MPGAFSFHGILLAVLIDSKPVFYSFAIRDSNEIKTRPYFG